MSRTSHPFEFTRQERHFTWSGDAIFHHMEIQSMPEVISARIKTRGHFEWTIAALLDAAFLWHSGRQKKQIAIHFGVTRQSVVGAIYRNRQLFPPRPSPIKRG